MGTLCILIITAVSDLPLCVYFPVCLLFGVVCLTSPLMNMCSIHGSTDHELP